MLANIAGLLVLIALALLFAWVLRRVWRSRNAIVKWGGSFVVGLITLLFTVVIVVVLIGFYNIAAPHTNPVATIQIATTQERVARGEHLSRLLCVECHSTNGRLPLSGGKDLSEDGPPLGTVVGSNLTPAGPLKNWSDG